MVLARGIEDAVHLRLSEQFQGQYSASFSRVFEEYVTELTDGLPHRRLTEAELKNAVSRHSPAVEVVLGLENANVLVEAKMSLFADDVLLTDNESVAFNKTKHSRDAISQGWKVGKVLREHVAFGTRFQKPADYLIVVTSRDLLLGGGRMLQELYRPGAFPYPDDDAKARLPMTHVFIMGIEDFETLMECTRDENFDLERMLQTAAVANSNPATGRLYFTQFLSGFASNRTRTGLLAKAADDAVERISRVV